MSSPAKNTEWTIFQSTLSRKKDWISDCYGGGNQLKTIVMPLNCFICIEFLRGDFFFFFFFFLLSATMIDKFKPL